jgi:hypothetical protein
MLVDLGKLPAFMSITNAARRVEFQVARHAPVLAPLELTNWSLAIAEQQGRNLDSPFA